MNITISGDDSTLNDFLVIFNNLGVRPNRFLIHDNFSGKEFNQTIQKYIQSDSNNTNSVDNVLTELIPHDNGYTFNKKYLKQINSDLWVSFIEVDSNLENFVVKDVCFFYKNQSLESTINEIFAELIEYIVDFEIFNNEKVNILVVNNKSVELESLSTEMDYDINQIYNKNIIKKIEKLKKKLNLSKRSAITIFSGERGLGKTTMSKYLSSQLDFTSIFIPNNLVSESIENSEFRNFIKKYDKILLIIDDCEFNTGSNLVKMSQFANSISQLTDCFLSSKINIQILLIFNQDKYDIDEYLTNSNNLMDVIEFDLLEPDLANSFLKKIGNKNQVSERTRLVDLFNSKRKFKKKNLGLE